MSTLLEQARKTVQTSEALTMSTDYPDLQEATIRQLQDGMTAGHFISLDLVKVRVASRISDVTDII